MVDKIQPSEVQNYSNLISAPEIFISDIYYDKRETYKNILPESEYKKLEAMKEDDNPCLLKLYFKK